MANKIPKPSDTAIGIKNCACVDFSNSIIRNNTTGLGRGLQIQSNNESIVSVTASDSLLLPIKKASISSLSMTRLRILY